jgi:hypothetical protein
VPACCTPSSDECARSIRYVCCYLVRKNYPLLLPTLDKTGVLSYAEAATVASIFETVVGVVKLFCGVRTHTHTHSHTLTHTTHAHHTRTHTAHTQARDVWLSGTVRTSGALLRLCLDCTISRAQFPPN